MALGPAGLPVLVPHSQLRFASVVVWVWPLWPMSPCPSGLAPPCPHWELDTHSQIGVEKTDMGGNQNPLLFLGGHLGEVGRVPTSLLKVAGRSGTGE